MQPPTHPNWIDIPNRLQADGDDQTDILVEKVIKRFGPCIREAYIGDKMRADAVFPRTRIILESKTNRDNITTYWRYGKNQLITYAAELARRNIRGDWILVLANIKQAHFRQVSDGIPTGSGWGKTSTKTWWKELIATEESYDPLTEIELSLWKSQRQLTRKGPARAIT